MMLTVTETRRSAWGNPLAFISSSLGASIFPESAKPSESRSFKATQLHDIAFEVRIVNQEGKLIRTETHTLQSLHKHYEEEISVLQAQLTALKKENNCLKEIRGEALKNVTFTLEESNKEYTLRQLANEHLHDKQQNAQLQHSLKKAKAIGVGLLITTLGIAFLFLSPHSAIPLLLISGTGALAGFITWRYFVKP